MWSELWLRSDAVRRLESPLLDWRRRAASRTSGALTLEFCDVEGRNPGLSRARRRPARRLIRGSQAVLLRLGLGHPGVESTMDIGQCMRSHGTPLCWREGSAAAGMPGARGQVCLLCRKIAE